MLILGLSGNCFADDGGLIVSNEFPDDGLMLENYVYKHAAVFENLGVYSGTVNAIAVYENVPIECNPGYYLPENNTECVICAENHFCSGGVNENATMESCPDGLVSPVGTTVADNCGKIMYIGEDVLFLTQTQQTHPALAVKMDDTVYYAKVTPVSSGAKPMNIGTTYSLRTMLDDVEYSIHDNTVQ